MWEDTLQGARNDQPHSNILMLKDEMKLEVFSTYLNVIAKSDTRSVKNTEMLLPLKY